MKPEIFGNFLHSISIVLRRLCLAHPIKYLEVPTTYYKVTLELRLADKCFNISSSTVQTNDLKIIGIFDCVVCGCRHKRQQSSKKQGKIGSVVSKVAGTVVSRVMM